MAHSKIRKKTGRVILFKLEKEEGKAQEERRALLKQRAANKKYLFY